MGSEWLGWLRGRKTYILAFVSLLATWLAVLFGEPVLGQPVMSVREAIEASVALLLAMTIRHGVSSAAISANAGTARCVLACAAMLGVMVGVGGCASQDRSDSQRYLEASRLYTASLKTVTPLIQAGILDKDDVERFEIVRAPAGRLLDQWEAAIRAGRAFDGRAALDALLNELVLLGAKGQRHTDKIGGEARVPPQAARPRTVIDERASDRGGGGGDSGAGAGDGRDRSHDRRASAGQARADARGGDAGHQRAPHRRDDLRGGLPRYWRERECGYRRPVFAGGGWGGCAERRRSAAA